MCSQSCSVRRHRGCPETYLSLSTKPRRHKIFSSFRLFFRQTLPSPAQPNSGYAKNTFVSWSWSLRCQKHFSDRKFKITEYGGLASPSSPSNDTQPVKNRLFSAYNPFLQDFSLLETLFLHPSALEPSVTIPKVLKSVEDLSISRINEQKAASFKAIIKDSMQQNPKILRNIFKAIQLEAIFDFTKFFYF